MSERIFEQAAALPYRVRGGRVEIALVTSRSGKRWVPPKGLIDPGESARDSASRECREEAGLVGEPDAQPIGRYEYEKWGGTCVVDVFPMLVGEVYDDWPEHAFRDRCWFPAEKAANQVREKALGRLIRQLAERLASNE